MLHKCSSLNCQGRTHSAISFHGVNLTVVHELHSIGEDGITVRKDGMQTHTHACTCIDKVVGREGGKKTGRQEGEPQ